MSARWAGTTRGIFARSPASELVGVYDVDAARAREVAAEFGTRAFGDLDDLLGQVEAVTVAVPTPAHAEVGLRALRRGIPVLMEKPLAVTLAEADALIAAAARKGVQLQVGHIERYNRALRAAEPYLAAPGTSRASGWRRSSPGAPTWRSCST